MDDVKISVVVPVYNSEDTLERCIVSILRQTYKNIELIIVDDGSTDQSNQILKRYSESDNRIVIIEQKNAGVSSARNKGIEKAMGEWITFVDADDYLDEQCLELVLSRIELAKTELVLWNRMDVFSDRMEKKRVYTHRENANISSQELIQKVFYNIDGNLEICSVCCRLFQRRLIYSKKLSFDENLSQGEDMVFMLDYLMNIKAAFWCDIAPYFRTMRNDSAMHRYNPDIDGKLNLLLDRISQRLSCITEITIDKFFNIFVLRGPITNYIECFVCNEGNQRSRKERAVQLKSFLQNEKVNNALYGIHYRDLPIRLKIKLFCVKHNVVMILDSWYRKKYE